MTYHHNTQRGIEQDDFIYKWIKEHGELTTTDEKFLAAYEKEFVAKFNPRRLRDLFRDGIVTRLRRFGKAGSSWCYVYRLPQ